MSVPRTELGLGLGLGDRQDAVARYLEASERCDIDALLATLSPEVELVSPISGRMTFRGRDDVGIIAAPVYGRLDGLRWEERADADGRAFVCGTASVGPFRIGDAMVFELDGDGRIARVRPHLRPWLGLTALAVGLLPTVARHPRAVLRALRPAM